MTRGRLYDHPLDGTMARPPRELTIVSQDVKDRIRRTIELIQSRQQWESDDLITKLDAVWTDD